MPSRIIIYNRLFYEQPSTKEAFSRCGGNNKKRRDSVLYSSQHEYNQSNNQLDTTQINVAVEWDDGAQIIDNRHPKQQ